MKDACVIGHFGFGENLLNGQTIKTKIVTDEIEKRLGSGAVTKIDTHGGLKAYLKLPLQLYRAVRDHKAIVILPAQNGLKVIVPILTAFNRLYRRDLIYVVIGGWLPDLIKSRRGLAERLKSFRTIFVETSVMKRRMEEQGFSNIDLMPNCKQLTITEDLAFEDRKPHRLCTFSRVMKEKGIEDAVRAVLQINASRSETCYTLDIYGQVDENQKEWFDQLLSGCPDSISYKGSVDFDKSVETIKQYYLLLFPTHFYTEGIPGTIIDSYASGVPVLCAKWESFSDIVEDGGTGVGYDFADYAGLVSSLETLANDPTLVQRMKRSCLDRAKDYLPDRVCSRLVELITDAEKK